MEFEPLKNYEGLYSINKNGDIRTTKRQGTKGGFIKPAINKYGYKHVSLCKDGIHKTYTLHRLLCIQFLENTNNYPVIDHINRNKLDNNLTNLRWTTYSINNENRTCKGCISKCVYKYKDNQYIYFRVSYRKQRKKFKKLEEAEKYLILLTIKDV